ncbi:MAG TPA: hypothetical protein VGP73_23050 [Thermoanaerobaculia bacterium]
MRSLRLSVFLLLGLLLFESGASCSTRRSSGLSPQPTPYQTFSGANLSLFAWAGNHVAFLTSEANRDPAVMARLLQVFDRVYDYYHQATGREPAPAKTFQGRDTIAVVDQTCGAGCGLLGSTGIELLKSTFEILYTGVRDRNQFDQVVFYEFGRNFWFFNDQIQYKQPDSQDSVATGYAVYMRFMSMDNTGVKPGPFNGVAFSKFRMTVEDLVTSYEADPKLTWSNTLRVGSAPANPLGLSGTDLFASFLMRLTRIYGATFPLHLWPAVAARPPARTTQDAVDNLVLAACAATSKNLVEVFADRWRWPVSSMARSEAKTRFGPPVKLP